MDHSAFSGLVTGTIAAEAARGCIPPTRRGIRRFRGEFAFVLRPSVPRAKRSRCRAPWRRARRRPATPSHLRGTPRFHPLPTHGRPWVPSATLLPATPSRHRGRPSVASRQRDRPAALNAATAGVRPLARGQSDHRGVQSLSRRQPLIGTGTGGLRGLRNTVRSLLLRRVVSPVVRGGFRGASLHRRPAIRAGRPYGAPAVGESAGDQNRLGRQTCRRHRREGRSARCGGLGKNRPPPRGKQVVRSSTYDRRSDRKCHRISRKSLKVKGQKIFRRGPTFFRRGFDHGENDQSIQAAETCIRKLATLYG